MFSFKKACSSFLRSKVSKSILTYNPIRNVTSIKEKIRKERAERLKATESFLPIKSFEDLNRIRNFGMISHINAGKTSVTERMLYYAGALVVPGDVDNGTAVMDYLDQERERRMTITSGLITFAWENHQFNLIDTPGHIDFNADVERSLKVLDGAVAIFDAVRGVQAQSETVWKQANKFNLPRIVFVNKMDKNGASLDFCVDSLRSLLNTNPLIIQIPWESSGNFGGVVDLIQMRKIAWKDELGDIMIYEQLTKTDPLYNKAREQRTQLIETLSLFDEGISKDFQEGRYIEAVRVEQSIRSVLLKNPLDACVVYVGSSLKNKGIQSLMDGIIKYLPSPNERDPVQGWDSQTHNEIYRYPRKDEKLCAYAFKVVNDIHKGSLVYAKIYSGVLTNRCHLYNTTKNIAEKGAQIYRVRADQYVDTPSLHAGDIVAIANLKSTFSGDTLIDQKDEEKIILEGVEVPPPVFIASIQYNSMQDKEKFDKGCSILTREDPSIVLEENEDSGQILIYGLGELHIEIFRSRLESEFGVPTTLGKMKVSYRESVSHEHRISAKLSKEIHGEPAFAHLELKIEPAEPEDLVYPVNEDLEQVNKVIFGGNVLVFDMDQSSNFMILYNEYKRRMRRKKIASTEARMTQQQLDRIVQSGFEQIKVIRGETHGDAMDNVIDEYGHDTRFPLRCAPFANIYGIELAIQNSLSKGSLIGAPIHHAKITIVGGSYSEQRSNQQAFEMCTANAMKELFAGAKPIILEPIMQLEVSTPSTSAKDVIHDIMANRRGTVMELQENNHPAGELARTTINAVIPLDELLGYSTYLRSLTKGEAHFVTKFQRFDRIGEPKQKEIVDNYV